MHVSPSSSILWDETTSHSTKLPKAAAKSLVIPQVGRAKRGGRSQANASLREFLIPVQAHAVFRSNGSHPLHHARRTR